MQEGDRVHALELYNDIFEEIGNDTAVLQLLVSPTRQAVNLARAYDSRDRKYRSDDGQEPAYQLVIEDLRREALLRIPPEPRPEEGQVSLFDDPAAAENVFESLNLGILPEEHAESAEPARPAAHEPAFYPDEDREDESAPLAPPPPAVPAVPAEPVTPAVEEVPAPETDKLSDVDAFLADFTLNDDFAVSEQTASTPTPIPSIPDEDVPQPLPEQPVKKEEPASARTSAHAQEKPQHADISTLTMEPQEHPARIQPQEEHTHRTQPQRKKLSVNDLPDLTGPVEREANVPLLILFIVLAIPLGLLCLGLILGAALLTLSMAAVFGFVGISGLMTAFSFAVFADILLVFGLSLAATAIGLLLAWTFIWLLIGAIPGFIRWILALGRKLCYKEVSA